MKPGYLFAAAILLLAAPAPAPAPAHAQPQPTVFVSLIDHGEFFHTIDAAMKTHATDYPDVRFEFADSGNDEKQQMVDIGKALKEKVSVLLVMSVSDKNASAIGSMAEAARIPVVYLINVPPKDNYNNRLAFVLSNDLVAGRLQMRVAAIALGNKGNIAILRGKDDNPATRLRTSGIKEVAAKLPDIAITQSKSAEWSREEAKAIVDGWINQGTKLDAILCNNDDMALGAVDSLKEHHIPPGKVFVGGVDGEGAAKPELDSGYLSMTMAQDAHAQAYEAVDDAVNFTSGKFAQLYDWIPYQIVLKTAAKPGQAALAVRNPDVAATNRAP